ncbi:hypothetical protein V502_06741 [Pseudogymnoascus sp. VKM F-4520 (FW-2644)]|nr:hypothetical protein V502_06741 [Pseudogymnoascus sp. VKM F-4520 (FW-2644)]
MTHEHKEDIDPDNDCCPQRQTTELDSLCASRTKRQRSNQTYRSSVSPAALYKYTPTLLTMIPTTTTATTTTATSTPDPPSTPHSPPQCATNSQPATPASTAKSPYTTAVSTTPRRWRLHHPLDMWARKGDPRGGGAGDEGEEGREGASEEDEEDEEEVLCYVVPTICLLMFAHVFALTVTLL